MRNRGSLRTCGGGKREKRKRVRRTILIERNGALIGEGEKGEHSKGQTGFRVVLMGKEGKQMWKKET